MEDHGAALNDRVGDGARPALPGGRRRRDHPKGKRQRQGGSESEHDDLRETALGSGALSVKLPSGIACLQRVILSLATVLRLRYLCDHAMASLEPSSRGRVG